MWERVKDEYKKEQKSFRQICPVFDPPSPLTRSLPRFIVTLNYLLRPTDTAAAGDKAEQNKKMYKSSKTWKYEEERRWWDIDNETFYYKKLPNVVQV